MSQEQIELADLYYVDRDLFYQIANSRSMQERWLLALSVDDPSLVDPDLRIDLFRILEVLNSGSSRVFHALINAHPRLVKSSISYIISSLRFPMENAPLIIQLLVESQLQPEVFQYLIHNLRVVLKERTSQRYIRYLVDSGYFWDVVELLSDKQEYSLLRDLSNWMLVNNSSDFQEISREIRAMLP